MRINHGKKNDKGDFEGIPIPRGTTIHFYRIDSDLSIIHAPSELRLAIVLVLFCLILGALVILALPVGNSLYLFLSPMRRWLVLGAGACYLLYRAFGVALYSPPSTISISKSGKIIGHYGHYLTLWKNTFTEFILRKVYVEIKRGDYCCTLLLIGNDLEEESGLRVLDLRALSEQEAIFIKAILERQVGVQGKIYRI